MPNPVPRGIRLTNKMLRMNPHSNYRESLRKKYRKKHSPFIPNPNPVNRAKALNNHRKSRRELKQTNGSRRNALNKSFSNRQKSNGRVHISTSPNRNNSNNLLNEMDPIKGPVPSEFNPIFYKASNGRPGVKLG